LGIALGITCLAAIHHSLRDGSLSGRLQVILSEDIVSVLDLPREEACEHQVFALIEAIGRKKGA
jgi:hypothetical protein